MMATGNFTRTTTAWLRKAVLYAWLAAIALWMVFPFYYAIISSLETGTAIFAPGLWPQTISLDNYTQLFAAGQFERNIFNSFIVSTTVVGFSVAVGVLAAWAFARVDFRGRRALLIAILSISMFPQIAILPGMYEMYTGWRGVTGDAGLSWGAPMSLSWLAFTYLVFTLPFTTWTITAYMKAIPRELEDAAVMDGASYFTIVTRIHLPLLWPALVVVCLMAFVVTWNEFLFALTFTSAEAQRTVTVAISMLSGSVEFQIPWGIIMAASVIVTLPLIALVLIFQRKLMANLAAGAVKG